jgi:HK97 family phage prohead protease
VSNVERRFTPMRVEARDASESRTIGGYASVFDSESRNLGGFVETIAPEAFLRSQSEGWPDVLARYNHDDNMLIGTSTAGTLRLSIDARGLLYEVDVPHSRQDVLELVQRGDVSQSSFAFVIPSDGDEWTYDEERDHAHRRVNVALLRDVAPVNTPAYTDATVGLRSLAEAKSADVTDVNKLAQSNELKRLFKRSDAPQTMYGPTALALVKSLELGA